MKFQVTTECPVCKKPYTREVYEEGIYAGIFLEICDDCTKTDEYGDIIITVEDNNNIYRNNLEG